MPSKRLSFQRRLEVNDQGTPVGASIVWEATWTPATRVHASCFISTFDESPDAVTVTVSVDPDPKSNDDPLDCQEMSMEDLRTLAATLSALVERVDQERPKARRQLEAWQDALARVMRGEVGAWRA